MGVATEQSTILINALSIGVQQGTGVSGAVQTTNTSLCNYYASQGASLYFPAGDYEFNAPISWPNTASNISVSGDGARLYQMANPARLFEFLEVDGVTVKDLHLFGSYHTHSDANQDGPLVTLIHATRCENVDVHHNVIEGNSGHGILLIGGRTLSVTDNVFRNGVWNHGGGSADSSDLKIQYNSTMVADTITICRNKFNTNTLIGVLCLRPAKHTICCDNQVITRDAAGNDITTYGVGNVRKEGLQLQYHTATGEGGTQTDDPRYEMQIIGNKVQGVRFGGISCQANSTGGETDGIRGNIANNLLRHCALEQDGNAANRIQGAIVVNNYRDLIVQGNVIKDCENVPAPNSGTAAIHLEAVAGVLPSGARVTLNVSDNTIADCRSRGIRCYATGDVLIQGNVLEQVAIQQINVGNGGGTVARAGKVQLQNNRMTSTLPISGHVVRLTGQSSDQIVTGNYIEMTGAWSGTTYALNINGTRMRIHNNTLVGEAAPGVARGILFDNSAQQRFDDVHIANNHIEGFQYGLFLSGNTDPQRGPMIHHNTEFVNCTNNVWAGHDNELFSGHWNSTTNSPLNCVVWGDDVPTSGNWLAGDVMWHINAASTEPMGWICTVDAVGGNGGTWIPMAAIP